MSGAADLSRELRTGSDPSLSRRRWIVGLSVLSSSSMSLISLYQMGILKHLPEPPLPMLDADKVDASEQAYELLSTPDGVLGLGSYAATMALAAAGAADRARSRPWLPLALLAKTVVDSAAAAKLTVDQWRNHRAFCSWCLLSAAATFATVPLAVPEALSAAKRLAR